MAGAYKYRPQYTQNTIGPSPDEPEPETKQQATEEPPKPEPVDKERSLADE
jgi:hypothetical protein